MRALIPALLCRRRVIDDTRSITDVWYSSYRLTQVSEWGNIVTLGRVSFPFSHPNSLPLLVCSRELETNPEQCLMSKTYTHCCTELMSSSMCRCAEYEDHLRLQIHVLYHTSFEVLDFTHCIPGTFVASCQVSHI